MLVVSWKRTSFYEWLRRQTTSPRPSWNQTQPQASINARASQQLVWSAWWRTYQSKSLNTTMLDSIISSYLIMFHSPNRNSMWTQPRSKRPSTITTRVEKSLSRCKVSLDTTFCRVQYKIRFQTARRGRHRTRRRTRCCRDKQTLWWADWSRPNTTTGWRRRLSSSIGRMVILLTIRA